MLEEYLVEEEGREKTLVLQDAVKDPAAGMCEGQDSIPCGVGR